MNRKSHVAKLMLIYNDLCALDCVKTCVSIQAVGFQIASILLNDVLNMEDELWKNKMLSFLAR